jgi:hypothetical protein
MKTLSAHTTWLFFFFLTVPFPLFSQLPNCQFSILSKSENSIRIQAKFSEKLSETTKPNLLIALPGADFESIEVKKIEIGKSYVSSGLFTNQFISNTSIIEVRGYHLLKIEFDPFIKLKKGIPVSGIEVEVTFSSETLSESNRRLRHPSWDQLINGLVINPENIKISKATLPSRNEDGAEYLIITHDMFLESCQEIIEFRTQQGISTIAVPLSVTGSSVDEIESYINNAYNTWTIPPTSILLIGDMELLPAPVWQGYSVSDNIYADVNGDELPDIFISRIPVQTINELDIIFQKIISHETDPPTNPDYFQHPLACADHTNGFGYGWMVSEIFNGWCENEFGKEPNRQYSGQNPGPANWPHPELYQTFGPDGLDYIPESPEYLGDYTNGNADGINAGLNSGAMSLFSYTHGSSSGWQPPGYTLADMTGITDAQPNYLFAINSLNGQYHNPSDCIAEAFLKHPHGSLGVIAPTEVLYSEGTEWYTVGLIDGLWDDFYPANNPTQYFDFIYPCAANTSAKYFVEFLPYPISPSMKSVVYNLFHYFGEPYSVLHDQVPQPLDVSHANFFLPDQTEFPIIADEGSTVSLVLNNEICSVEISDGTYLVMPLFDHQLGDTLHVTVTKQNHIRYHSMVICQLGIGIEEENLSGQIEIFPNPADKQFQISFKKEISGNISISLTDMYSREIKTTFVASSNKSSVIEVKDIKPGVYLLKIEGDDFSFTEKVIVQH